MILPGLLPAGTELTATVVQPSVPPGPQDPGGRGEDFGKSSPLGFLVLILFFIAVAFLIRSMTKHLKRVPESFDDPPTDDDSAKPNGANGNRPEPAS